MCLNQHISVVYKVQDQGTSRFDVWWGPCSWFIDSCLLSVPSDGRRAKELSRPPLQGHWSYSWALHYHDLITPQKPHFKIPSLLGLSFNICILGRHRQSTSSTETQLFLLWDLTPTENTSFPPSHMFYTGWLVFCGLLWLDEWVQFQVC